MSSRGNTKTFYTLLDIGFWVVHATFEHMIDYTPITDFYIPIEITDFNKTMLAAATIELIKERL